MSLYMYANHRESRRRRLLRQFYDLLSERLSAIAEHRVTIDAIVEDALQVEGCTIYFRKLEASARLARRLTSRCVLTC